MTNLQVKDQPLVTVGIPFYNCLGTLAAALASILQQTHANLEIILVDDGSSDGSTDVVGTFTDPRIRLVQDGTNRGLADRLNQINAMARGEYIMRMDADDISHPRRVEHLLGYLAARPDVDVVGSMAYIVDDSMTLLAVRPEPSWKFDLDSILRQRFIVHATIMARRTWALSNPYNPEDRASEDFGLWLRSLAKSTFALVPLCLYVYRNPFPIAPRKYRRYHAAMRRILWRDGRGRLPRLKLYRCYLESVAKQLAFQLLTLIKLIRPLLAARNGTAPSLGQQEDCRQVLHATQMALTRYSPTGREPSP